MPDIVTIVVNNEERKAVELSFDMTHMEPWNEYAASDGGRFRIKTYVRKVFRLLDEEGNPSFTQDGDPFYWVTFNTDVIASN
jgi:hypothetical protein